MELEMEEDDEEKDPSFLLEDMELDEYVDSDLITND